MRPVSLKVRALQWLAQREHSPAELRGRLLRAARGQQQRAERTRSGRLAAGDGGFDADEKPDAEADAEGDVQAILASTVAEVDELIVWLTTHGYLSAQRFVDSRVVARQARQGTRRIAQELQHHGLSLDAESRLALQATEYERAHALWLRRYGTPAADAAGRVRQMRFLAGRGFSHEVIRRVLRQTPGGSSGND